MSLTLPFCGKSYPSRRGFAQRGGEALPGIALAALVAIAAFGLQEVELRLFGRAWLETLVLAIVLGVACRSLVRPGARFAPGIQFCAKILLEIAVVLLGASIDARRVIAAGPLLVLGIVALVVVSIALSYSIGRLFQLPHRMAILVAAGNSICGNSAIAAIAPAIGADSDDVVAAIAFTAVLGVATVLLLPLVVPLLGLSFAQYGVLAGLTVYAVPQVLAATVPVAAQSAQIGTLVKLLRVLMLGPVVLFFAVRQGRGERGTLPPLHHLVPWFIVGFLLVGAVHSVGLIPEPALPPIGDLASLLTILAMAALGLGVDIRAVARSGKRILLAATLSLLMLGGISLGLVFLLPIG